MKPAAIVAAFFAALLVQYLALIRPWYKTWGATNEELEQALPGDALAPRATNLETRAITIDAPPERVWPWVAQIGQRRGGFYSYRLLENLVGCEMPDADRVLGLPDPRPGERMWMAPPHRFGGVAYATYAAVDPGRSMVLLTYGIAPPRPDAPPGGTWAFVLEPAPGGATRLLVRGRSGIDGEGPTLASWAFAAFVFDPIHFAMERKMLLELERRAEGRGATPAWVDATEVVLWALSFLFGVSAAVAALLRREAAWKPLAAGTAALVVLTFLFFARPPVAIAVLLVTLVRWALSWSARRRAPEPAAA